VNSENSAVDAAGVAARCCCVDVDCVVDERGFVAPAVVVDTFADQCYLSVEKTLHRSNRAAVVVVAVVVAQVSGSSNHLVAAENEELRRRHYLYVKEK